MIDMIKTIGLSEKANSWCKPEAPVALVGAKNPKWITSSLIHAQYMYYIVETGFKQIKASH